VTGMSVRDDESRRKQRLGDNEHSAVWSQCSAGGTRPGQEEHHQGPTGRQLSVSARSRRGQLHYGWKKTVLYIMHVSFVAQVAFRSSLSASVTQCLTLPSANFLIIV